MPDAVDENARAESVAKMFGPTEASRDAFRVALDEGAASIDVPELLRHAVNEDDAGQEDVPVAPDASLLADAWNAFGDVLFNRSCSGFLAAEHAYRMALATDPGRSAAFRGLGECLARHKRLDEARLVHDAWFACWITGEGGAEVRRRQDARLARSPILFVAMQKSASEYIRDTLVEALDIPLLYTSIGTIPRDRFVPSALRQLARGGALSRIHSDAGDLAAVADAGIERLVLHIRDPRQVTLSWTHMMRRLTTAEFNYATHMYDPAVPESFQTWSLAEQLAWAVSHYLPPQADWIAGWLTALDAGCGLDVLLTTFDEFHHDPDRYFQRLLNHVGISDVAASDLHPQDPAATRNFRSGDPDEWKQVFDADMRKHAWPHMAGFADRFGWTY
ncbi:MAG: hypothetical protein ABUL53_11380 [Bradyrhizobium guangdongense]